MSSAPTSPSPVGDATLKGELVALAGELGFVRAGVAEADALGEEGEALRRFVEEGRHGEMDWLARTVDVRIDPRHEGMVEGAKSVLVLAAPYHRRGPPVGPAPGRVARYAVGRDYHNVLTRRVRKIERFLRERGFSARASVDSRPVLERAWAQRAGLGFMGKNCCLIVPGLGSHLFLSCVITTARLPSDAPMTERCGSCRACLDACPTDAFVESRQLDARRCISYLTIEERGSVPEELREGIGEWLFGCDVCQDVCPYNQGKRAPRADDAFAPDSRFEEVEAGDLLAMSERRFAEWSRGSPVKRPGRAGMARNAAIVLGNRGGRRHLPILRAAESRDPDPAVREASRWAIARIDRRREDDEPSC